MVQAYRTDNPWDGVAKGYGLGNALRSDVTRSRAGASLAAGDYAGGANALLSGGEIESGLRVQSYGQGQQAAAATQQKAREKEGLEFTAETASRLAQVQEAGGDVLSAFEQVAPRFQQYDSPEEVEALRQRLRQDPKTTLTMLGAGAAKKLGLEVRNVGDEVLVIDPNQGGKLIQRYRGARTVNVADGGALYELPGSYGEPQAGEAGEAGPGLAVAPASAPTAAPDVEAVWQAAIQQESGGRAGVLGPQTEYGRAEGLTQMLPATAEAMARKVGVPWNPALMRESSPQARAYQEKLGRAYFEEGLEKYGGDPEKALMYYHGGPNEALWGPKTQAHAAAVMGRVQPYDVASNGETPPSSGPRLLMQRPKAEKPKDAPSGYRWKGDTLEFIPGGPADPKAQAAGGKVTEGERTAGFLASRLADSLKNLTEISGRSPDSGKPGLWETAAEKTPWVGGPGSANLVRDADRQQVIANQLDILDAALTLGTGAAYTREQLENYRATYFPVLTDKPETVISKRQKLISLLNAAKIKAGPAAPPELDTALAAARVQFGDKPKDGEGAVRTVRTPAEAQALPPGTKFRTPDGQVRVRK